MKISQSHIFFYLIPLFLPVSIYTADQINPAIAFNGNSFLVVWQVSDVSGFNEIHARRVSLEGQYIDTQDILISPFDAVSFKPGVIHGSSEYFVVWADNHKRFSLGARVSYSGSVITNDITIASAPGFSSDNKKLFSLAFDGNNYFYTKTIYYGLVLQCYRLSQSGVIIDTIKIYCCDQSSGGQCICGKSNYLVVWNNFG